MAKKSKKGGGEMLIIASKAKAQMKKNKCNTAFDAMDGLNGWVHWLINQACERAKANGRKTVRAHDFMA
ncbi:MAG: hypothetical protein AB7O96_12290 [Pseudobdellovibrionaceae bacterium]